jgi:hypothetical protein
MCGSNMEIPEQFEFNERQWQLKDKPEISKFVTVLDKFEHHYSQEMMYYIRIEYIGIVFASPQVEYEVVKESVLLEMLEKRKLKG